MALTKSIDVFDVPMPLEVSADPWAFNWPNTADFNFNYWTLLNGASTTGGIAKAPGNAPRIAIIGAGVAGLTAARELYRSGYTNIDIYEATDRIGGRNYSIPMLNASNQLVQHTTYEMGAMRMPFFPKPGSQNSVLDYYVTNFAIALQPFPDPASKAVASTGIYVNNGLGPDPANPLSPPQMQVWESSSSEPPGPMYQAVFTLWETFAQQFTGIVQQQYLNTATWPAFWQSIVANYWNMTFREFAVAPAITYDPSNPGAFGGLGMTQAQAWVFYVIGAGDGGWGAFFDISVLYPLRTLLFGYATNHQLVRGLFNGPNGQYSPGPYSGGPVVDSLGNPLTPPFYLGLQSVAESLFYVPFENSQQSLCGAMQPSAQAGFHLFMQTPATSIALQGPGVMDVTSAQGTKTYGAVIVTTPTWALEMSCPLIGFSEQQLPYNATLSIKESHWITSCKVFFPLLQSYWLASNIPQVINTDTFLQDVYGIASGSDPGVVLVSYTWEDDAIKLAGTTSDAGLATMCLAELDRILVESGYPTMSSFVDFSMPPTVIRWENQPTYRGCAKLYREMSWTLDYALLTYNQNISAASGLYFAGEGYSVEGGWTEPALRLALDAVINLAQNTGATFNGGFDPQTNYPRYSAWDPSAPAQQSKHKHPDRHHEKGK
jgi:tryptophan 2-monooxygenase